MNAMLWTLDFLLCGLVLWLAWQALATADLFKGTVLFIAFGLVMAIAWARLDAPDIALAEAVIGAGLTGVLLLFTLAAMSPQQDDRTPPEPNP